MKALSILLFTFLVSATTSKANTSIRAAYTVADSVYSEENVDKKPEPVKGTEDVYKKIAKTYRYPAEALKKGVQGKIQLYLTISAEGKIIDVSIKEGLGLGTDEEAIRTFKTIKTDWYPGVKNNQKVNTRIMFPLSLNLEPQ